MATGSGVLVLTQQEARERERKKHNESSASSVTGVRACVTCISVLLSQIALLISSQTKITDLSFAIVPLPTSTSHSTVVLCLFSLLQR